MKGVTISRGVKLLTLICDECGAVCNSDDENSPHFWSSYTTVTTVTGAGAGKEYHYCINDNTDCHKKSKQKGSE